MKKLKSNLKKIMLKNMVKMNRKHAPHYLKLKNSKIKLTR